MIKYYVDDELVDSYFKGLDKFNELVKNDPTNKHCFYMIAMGSKKVLKNN